LKTREIELAVANWLNYRQNIIVPNVSWGLLDHEADLFSVNVTGYATEIEIKVSASDLKKDASKPHGHRSNLIKYLYFAIPESLLKYSEFIPERAGILVCNYNSDKSRVYVSKDRDAYPNKSARKLTEKEISHTAHLGCMRIFNMKKRIIELERERNENNT
jgi:hypothetical protein